jgi:hypothetical protein
MRQLVGKPVLQPGQRRFGSDLLDGGDVGRDLVRATRTSEAGPRPEASAPAGAEALTA